MLLRASTRCAGTRFPNVNLVLLVGIKMVYLRGVSLVRAIYQIEKINKIIFATDKGQNISKKFIVN